MNKRLPKVYIVVLNYNGWKDTIECLESVYNIKYPNWEVILVDNGSTDNSIEKIKYWAVGKIHIKSKFLKYDKKRKPIKYIKELLYDEVTEKIKVLKKFKGWNDLLSRQKLSILRIERNLGFTGGSNVGIKYANSKRGADYILLLSNDVVVDRDFLGKLVMFAESNQKIGLIQPKILRYKDSKLDNTGVYLDIFGATMLRGYGEKDKNQYDSKTDRGFFYISGACILIKKELIAKLGDKCFDEALFAYYEDVDLSWIARLLGFRLVFLPRSTCFHKGGKTLGNNPNTVFWSYRNRIRVLIKNYSIKNLIWTIPTVILLGFLSSLFVSIYRRNFNHFYGFLRGLFWNIVNFKDTLEKRSFVQSIRKIDDKEIMKNMKKYPLEFRILIKKLH